MPRVVNPSDMAGNTEEEEEVEHDSGSADSKMISTDCAVAKLRWIRERGSGGGGHTNKTALFCCCQLCTVSLLQRT